MQKVRSVSKAKGERRREGEAAGEEGGGEGEAGEEGSGDQSKHARTKSAPAGAGTMKTFFL